MTYSQVLGIRVWSSLGREGGTLFYLEIILNRRYAGPLWEKQKNYKTWLKKKTQMNGERHCILAGK